MPLPLPFSRDFMHAVDSQGGAAGAAVTCTLVGVPNRTTWILGFHISTGVVAAAIGGALFVGPVLDEPTGNSKTLAYGYLFPISGLVQAVAFPGPLPAIGPNQQIQVAIGAIAGGPAISLAAFGIVS